jgi:hypothetical protein
MDKNTNPLLSSLHVIFVWGGEASLSIWSETECKTPAEYGLQHNSTHIFHSIYLMHTIVQMYMSYEGWSLFGVYCRFVNKLTFTDDEQTSDNIYCTVVKEHFKQQFPWHCLAWKVDISLTCFPWRLSLLPESIEWFDRGPGCLTVIWFGSYTNPYTHSPISMFSFFLWLHMCRRSSLLMGGGGDRGGAKS